MRRNGYIPKVKKWVKESIVKKDEWGGKSITVILTDKAKKALNRV